ncbi:hypothetical protein [Kitasatospora sp. NPDC002040]|uniref:LppU/SCO3897 family protein n=1 Tax=Kitasatospora sp. NPDC002040 TaxID=3154661 RepID=UPI00332969D4
MSTPQTPPGRPVPPAAASGRSLRTKLLSGLGVLLVIAVVMVAKVGIRDAFSEDPVRAGVGDCVAVTGGGDAPKVEAVGCDDARATHTVSKVVDDTFDPKVCDDEFDALSQQLDSDRFVLCLTPRK